MRSARKRVGQVGQVSQVAQVAQVDFPSFLARQRHGVLSSLSGVGNPQSALVGIAVTPALEIIFDTLKSSRKYANLIARPDCSFVAGWAGEQTVQWEGLAEELKGAELLSCLEIYFAAWPDGRARKGWPEIAYFVARPRWIRYSDFDPTPAVIQEFAIRP